MPLIHAPRLVSTINAELSGAKAAVAKAKEVVDRLEREKQVAESMTEAERQAKEAVEVLASAFKTPPGTSGHPVITSVDILAADELWSRKLHAKIRLYAGDEEYVIERTSPYIKLR